MHQQVALHPDPIDQIVRGVIHPEAIELLADISLAGSGVRHLGVVHKLAALDGIGDLHGGR